MTIVQVLLIATAWFIAGLTWRRRPRATRGDNTLARLEKHARWCRDKKMFLADDTFAPVTRCILTVDDSDYWLAITPHSPGVTLVVAKAEQETIT